MMNDVNKNIQISAHWIDSRNTRSYKEKFQNHQPMLNKCDEFNKPRTQITKQWTDCSTYKRDITTGQGKNVKSTDQLSTPRACFSMHACHTYGNKDYDLCNNKGNNWKTFLVMTNLNLAMQIYHERFPPTISYPLENLYFKWLDLKITKKYKLLYTHAVQLVNRVYHIPRIVH